MDWILDNLFSIIVLIINLIVSTQYPRYLQWKKDKHRNFHAHPIWTSFKLASNEIDKLRFVRRNEIRAANIKNWLSESNAYILEYCVYLIDGRILDKNTKDFNYFAADNMTKQLDKFRQYCENTFEPIVLLKFGENTIQEQNRLVTDIEFYLRKKSLSNRQKAWFILNDIRKYIDAEAETIAILNNLNGDLDKHEQALLKVT